MKNFVKAILVSLSLVLFRLATSADTVFAGMGSTGGGGGGGSGGGGAGSSGHGTSIEHLTPYAYMPFTLGNVFNGLFITFAFTSLYMSILHIDRRNRLDVFGIFIIVFLIAWLVPHGGLILFLGMFVCMFLQQANMPVSYDSFAKKDFLTPNITLHDFQHWMLTEHLSFDEQGAVDKQRMVKRYIDAQMLYSDLIRENMKHWVSTKRLHQYLGSSYYQAMYKEIDLKVHSHTYDDIKIDHVKIGGWMIYHDYKIAQLYVYGKDMERQADYDNRISFERNNWIDYVVYDGNYKIINIIYGDHFHLDGKDFNTEENTAEHTVERDFDKHELPDDTEIKRHDNNRDDD